MSHSKRNTSLAFFTSHERSQLKNTWGSQSTRLTRDSFLPFAACRLCLLPAVSPVACSASGGDIFCRECAVSNLLAQRKELKRLERDEERKRKEGDEELLKEDEAVKERAVREFERVQMGLEVKPGGERNGDRGGRKIVGREGGKIVVEEEEVVADETVDTPGKRGAKRKFELDEEELLRIAREERASAKRSLDDEKSKTTSSTLPSFWVPSLTPSTKTPSSTTNPTNPTPTPLKPPKPKHPTCPASSTTSPHPFTLKTLLPLHFTEEDPQKIRTCPACRKALSNGVKAVATIPCGHVLCSPCVTKFMAPSSTAISTTSSLEQPPPLTCYVCSTPLSTAAKETNPTGSKKASWGPGLLELSSEGTGFAGGGKNTVKREGVVFQC
ncbi:MAG: hypothetical protein M1817_004542 [Caeruleum heppii]|nr:MAG: hypothetical protein M1817_004542 [Caeruleum heppii]